MEELHAISQRLIEQVSTRFERKIGEQISWNNQLIGIKGARGVGKTTLLLQQLKNNPLKHSQKLYVSLDELYFTSHSLLEFASTFYQEGGKIIVLDEVHKYENWAREIKNLYDRYQDLQIVFTGSSIIDITRQEADLSRRALMYTMQGLSYREYLHYEYDISLPVINLQTIINDDFLHEDHFPREFRPLQYFTEYLQYGYYPFRFDNRQDYMVQLRKIIRTMVEYDMAEIKGFDIRQAKKLLQLLYIIAQQAPFKPNISKLAEKTNIHRNSLPNYLYFMEESKLLALLYYKSYSISSLQKPEKVYLENPNMVFALCDSSPESGAIRETFFYNQMSNLYTVNQSKDADFLIDKQFTFEIGGPSKQRSQIKAISNAWIVKDKIVRKTGKAIPLWLFGFLY